MPPRSRKPGNFISRQQRVREKPKRAGDLLSSLFHSPGVKAKISRYAALPEWEEVAGPELAAVSFPEKVQRGTTLVVRVIDAVWAQELSLRKGEFLDRLRRIAPTSLIDEIRFVTGDPKQLQKAR